MAGNRLQIILSGQVENFNTALREAQQQADKSFGAISSKAQQASLVFAGLGVSATAMAKSFVSRAVEMQQFEGTLTAVTGSSEIARAELAAFVEMAASTPFDLPGVVEAGVKLKALGQDAQAWLPLAGELAAVMGRNIPDAAAALAKALSGSQDGLTQLQDTYAVSKRELIAAGAATKQQGVIALETASDLQALDGALRQVIASKFGGTMEAQAKTAAGAFANLDDAIEQLKAGLGEEIAPTLAGIARSITGVVESLNAVPGPTKAMVAQTVLGVGALATFAAAASGAVVVFGPLVGAVKAYTAVSSLSTAVTLKSAGATLKSAGAMALATAQRIGMTTAIAAAVGPTTAASVAMSGLAATSLAAAKAAAAFMLANPVGAVLGLGAALAAYVHSKGRANDAAEASLAIQEAAAKRFRESRQEIIATADALREYGGNVEAAIGATVASFQDAGMTDLDAAKAILVLTEQRNQAWDDGNEALAASLQERIKVLNGVRAAMSGTHLANEEAEKRAAAAAEANIAAQTRALEDYKKFSSAGIYETKQEQLSALDAVLARLNRDHAEYEALELSRVRLAREAASELTSAEDEARKERLAGAMRELDRIKALGDDNLQQRKRFLQAILAEHELSVDERHRFELEILNLERDINQKRVDAVKKAEDEKRKAAEQTARVRAQLQQSEMQLAQTEIQSLQDRLAQGEDVLSQLKEQLQLRQQLAEQVVRESAERDKAGKTAQEQAMIEKTAQNEIAQTRSATGREVETLDRKAAQQKKQALLEAKKLQEQLNAAQLEANPRRTQADVVKAAKERLALQEEQLALQAEMAAESATPEERARIAVQLEFDLFRARQQSTAELARATAELEKQKQAVDELKGATLGGVQSLEEMVSEMNTQFASQRKRESADVTEDGPDLSAAGRDLGLTNSPLQQEQQLKDIASDLKDSVPASGALAADIVAGLKDALTVQVEIRAPSGEMSSDWKWSSY